MAAGQDTMIKAVAVDGAFTSQFFNEHLHTKTQLPSFPFTPQIHWIADKVYDIDFTKIAPEKTLEDWNPRPTFLIAGEKDQIVPVEDTRILYQKINNDPKVEFWEIPEGRHIRSYDIQPEKYQKKVVGFFQEHL